MFAKIASFLVFSILVSPPLARAEEAAKSDYVEEAEEYPDPQPNAIEAAARERYHKTFHKLESSAHPAPTPAGMPGSLLNPSQNSTSKAEAPAPSKAETAKP